VSHVERHELPSGAAIYFKVDQHSYWTGYDEDKGTCSGRIGGASTIAKNNGDTNTDGLLDWSARLTCEGVAELPLGGTGLFNAEGLAANLKESKLWWRDIRNAKGSVGTASHDVLETLARGDSPVIRNGYDLAVLNWFSAKHRKCLHAEKVVYSEEHCFAGRFDWMELEDDAVVLKDLKTSKYIGNSFAVQLNLYRLAAKESGYPLAERLAVVQVRDDGAWREVEIPIKPHWATHAIRIAQSGKEISSTLRQANRTEWVVPVEAAKAA
jgi:hypothetical protein